MTWIVQAVRTTTVESLDGFVKIEFGSRGFDYPIYRFDDDRKVLWKSACSIKVFDDGRVHVRAESHLTPRQRQIVAGLAEEAWRGGPEKSRREKWRRIRRTKDRPVASRGTWYWVRAERGEPGYAEAHADMAMALRTQRDAFDSQSVQWMSTP